MSPELLFGLKIAGVVLLVIFWITMEVFKK